MYSKAITYLRTNASSSFIMAGILAYITIAVFKLNDYLIFSLNSLLGLLLAPYVFISRSKRGPSKFYICFTALLLLLYCFNPQKTLLFMALATAIIFALESVFGRSDILTPLLLLIISPVFSFASSFISIPIRLELSSATASIFELAGYKAGAIGNTISLNGFEYSVDQACAGLNMMATSLILGIFMIAYFGRNLGKMINNFTITGSLAVVFLLTISGNLFRIMLLVIFNIPPENPAHEYIGIISLICYILIPSYFIIKWIFEKYSCKAPEKQAYLPGKASLVMNCLLVSATLMAVLYGSLKKQPRDNVQAQGLFPSYKIKSHQNGILQLDKEGILLYIKPIKNFYSSEHSPLICWKGSGYSFKNYSTVKINDKEVYWGELRKGNETIHTCWWFDNGQHQTISQFDWRWRALKGENNFNLININASEKDRLLKEARVLLAK